MTARTLRLLIGALVALIAAVTFLMGAWIISYCAGENVASPWGCSIVGVVVTALGATVAVIAVNIFKLARRGN